VTTKLRVSIDEQDHQGTRVALSGPLDVATASEFLAAVEDVAHDHEHDDDGVILDLSQLEHLDSIGLAALLRAVADLQREHALTMRRAPARVHRLFVLTGADRRLPFDDGRQAAPRRRRGEQS
jgi:anti-anti-sigma factor